MVESVEKFIFIRFLYRDEILPSRVTSMLRSIANRLTEFSRVTHV